MGICEEILKRWSFIHGKVADAEREGAKAMEVKDIEERIHEIMEQQAQSVVAVKQRTQEEQEMRDAILTQYGVVGESSPCFFFLKPLILILAISSFASKIFLNDSIAH